MIARSTQQIQQPNWISVLRDSYSDPIHLLRDLGLSPTDVEFLHEHSSFAFRVPRPFVSRMRPADPKDPLLLQVLPRRPELLKTLGSSTDPVGDLSQRVSPALIQKYHGRALMIISGGCAINCRYCFRRHFPYADSVGAAQVDQAIDFIRGDHSISEIILSGGDPLLLKDEHLQATITRLATIPHLRQLRVHTRLPVTIPSRITDSLLHTLTTTKLSPVIVFHINHPNEIDAELSTAFDRCRSAGIMLLNQSVLLRGINDDAATLRELSEALFAASVLPYYVHLLDPVDGAAHFDVSVKKAISIAANLRAQLPGYLMPRFVREIAGENSKVPIA
ncbi:MAG TPA: EF-P beta-lysylation protein EpmB [Gammaproteobacteria bacterium]|nr:EF-P beta-lysylation protein EpmB [Gammaproteobacteria bacterium]